MFGNMKAKTVKLLAWICIGIFLVAMTSCGSIKRPKPMLKITTTSQAGFLPGPTRYYIVYDNGAVKKTDKFVSAKVEHYLYSSVNGGPKELYGIDIATQKGEELKQIANNILLLTEEPKLKIVAVGGLFVLGERYFFDISCSINESKSISKLFEYSAEDNSIQEVASLNKGSINHVELYEPQ